LGGFVIRKTIFCSLVLLAGAPLPLMAQIRDPEPRPKSGTHAYTAKVAEEMRGARQAYEEACKTNATDLRKLSYAWALQATAKDVFLAGVRHEVKDSRQVREARDESAYRERIYQRLAEQKTDLVAEDKAYAEVLKARAKLKAAEDTVTKNILAAVDPDGEGQAPNTLCPPHRKLQDAFNEALHAEYAKREAERKAKEQAAAAQNTGSATNSGDCKNNGAAAGAINQLACQEGK
jgi:hypothetical protein